MKNLSLKSVCKNSCSTVFGANCKQLMRRSEQFLKKDSNLFKQFSFWWIKSECIHLFGLQDYEVRRIQYEVNAPLGTDIKSLFVNWCTSEKDIPRPPSPWIVAQTKFTVPKRRPTLDTISSVRFNSEWNANWGNFKWILARFTAWDR